MNDLKLHVRPWPIAKWIVLAAGAVALFAICWYFIVPLFCSSVSSFDIAGGRERHQKFILGVQVYDRSRDTALTTVYREVVGEPPPPVWGPIDGVDGLKHWAGHYGADSVSGRGMGEELAVDGLFTDDAKRAAVAQFFGLLQKNEPAAADYAIAVMLLGADCRLANRGGIGVKDLPVPCSEKEGP